MRKGERTRQRVLDVAEALFAERGYDATTLTDVAVGANLRPPSLYNHFDSKDVLYTAVLERACQPILDLLRRFLSHQPTADDIPELTADIVNALASHPNVPRLVAFEALRGSRELVQIVAAWIGPFVQHGMEVQRRVRPSGRWSLEELPFLVMALGNVFLGYFAMSSLFGAAIGMDALSEPMIQRQTRFVQKLLDVIWAGPDVADGRDTAGTPGE
jgi:AcrR family transcriptional regulator